MEEVMGMAWKERYGRSWKELEGMDGMDGMVWMEWKGWNGWNSVQRYNFSLILPNLGV